MRRLIDPEVRRHLLGCPQPKYWSYLAAASLLAAYYIHQLRRLRVEQSVEDLSRAFGNFPQRK